MIAAAKLDKRRWRGHVGGVNGNASMKRAALTLVGILIGGGLAAAESFPGLPPEWRQETIDMCRHRAPGSDSALHRCLARQEHAALEIASINVGAGVPREAAFAIMISCEEQARPDVEAFSRCMVNEAKLWQAAH